MRFTLYTQPGCAQCNAVARTLFLTGAEVEVLSEEDLAALDHDLRFRLHEQIATRLRTDLPIVFVNDVLTETEDIPCLTT